MDIKELKQQAKYQKKDILFSEVLGVCRVDELTRLSTQGGDTILYYGLRSIADQTKVSYVPVENHSVLLRDLVSVEEAKALLAEVAKAAEDPETAKAAEDTETANAAETTEAAATTKPVKAAGPEASEEKEINPLLIQEAQYVVNHFAKQ